MAVPSTGETAVSIDNFADLLESARKLVGAVGAPPPDAGAEDETAELRGTGTSPNGLVTAVSTVGGKVESVTVDPRAMRLDSHTLGEQVAAAVNAALEDLGGQAAEARVGGIDTVALSDQLRKVQETSVRQMHSFLQDISAAQQRLLAKER
jgi:DNA-binding protein YbaB